MLTCGLLSMGSTRTYPPHAAQQPLAWVISDLPMLAIPKPAIPTPHSPNQTPSEDSQRVQKSPAIRP